MKLKRLRIDRLAGIWPGFELEAFDPGINVIVGPNASGKTSLLRALRALLYREAAQDGALHLEGEFEDANGPLRAVRLGRDIHWTREGQPIEPPVVPEYRFHTCYTIQVEDLLAATEADSEIGARIARELAGGYDLGAVAHSFSVKRTHGKAEADALRKADKILASKRTEHAALRRDEERLEVLRHQRDEAAEANRGAESCRQALAALEARRKRRGCEVRLEAFPQGMEFLAGDELDRLARLRQRKEALQEDRKEAERSLQDARERLARSGLEGTALDEGMLAEQHRTLERFRNSERDIKAFGEARAKAEVRLKTAVEGLGGEPETPVHIDPETLTQVEQALSAKRELDGEIRALDAERDRLPEKRPDSDPDAIRAGRRELMTWLATPREPGWTAGRIVGFAVLVLTLLAAVGVAAWAGHVLLALLAVPAAFALYALVRPAGPGEAQRRDAQARYESLGLARPATWDESGVRKQLDALERELQQADEQLRQWHRREEVERERERRVQERQTQIESLAERARHVGFDPERLDTSFDRWLRLSQAYDQAYQELAEIREQLAASSEQANNLRVSLLQFLDSFGEAPMGQPDAETLGDRLAALSARLRMREKAEADQRAAERDRQRLDGELEETEESIRALYEKAGLELGDDAGLRTRLEQLEAWKSAKHACVEATSVERDRMQALEHRDDLLQLVEADDEGSLQQKLAGFEEQAARHEELQKEIIRIETEVNHAQQVRSLEEARAAHQQVENALKECLEAALSAEAGAFLLDRVRDEYETESQPAVLRNAKDWFGRFTRHQFELTFEGEGTGNFGARETRTSELRRLGELSSGTRMQLLMAVRLAFALEAERGREPMPFFLDEALTTSDPERFRAVTASLRTVASEGGRQVFYLTAQPLDATLWADGDEMPRVIDIAKVRRMQTAVTAPEVLSMPARTEPPAPGSRTPEEYAAMLGVPPIDPWSEASAIHLFYLLRDDLPLLHRLLRIGIEYVGALRALLDSAARKTLLSDDEAQRLRCRLDAVEAWHGAWRRGRGQPVDRAVIEQSPVSTNFVDRVSELAEEVEGDAHRLIEAIETGAVKRFRSAALDELREWFVEHGYLDEREPLSDAELYLAALSAVQTSGGAENWNEETVTMLVGSLEAGVSVSRKGTDAK